MIYLTRAITAVTLMSVMSTTALANHPYHVSLTEVEWNEKTASFEVSICLWPADLEKALSGQEKKPIDLDKTANLDELILRYVKRKIVCRSGDHDIANIHWVGFESNNKQSWIYFELKTSAFRVNEKRAQNQIWTLQNKMFFELNDDQLNQINFRRRSGEFLTGICSRGNSRFVLNKELNGSPIKK